VATDDHGLEVLKKSGEQVSPGNQSDYYIKVGSVSYTVRLDKVSSSLTYIGYAVPGSSESASVWMIRRLSKSGNVTTIDFADSDSQFNNIWANRTGLTYG
jgi:hypothetical protein